MTRHPPPPRPTAAPRWRAWACGAACSAVLAAPAAAQQPPAPGEAVAPPAAEPVIVPQVQRRDLHVPRLPSRDFSVGLYAGVYATQNFGSSSVQGLRLAYHVTEDVFVEAAAGHTRVSDEMFRQVLPGGIFERPSEKLDYTQATAGFNLLPGEVFFGRSQARLSQGYLAIGVGSTRLAGQKRQTLHLGGGLRVLLGEWLAVQADVRDHRFSLDLLGKRQSTHNLEATLGLSVFF